MLSIAKRIIRWMVVAFFASTILSVVAYRFIPVLVTPLMVIRVVQQFDRGEGIRLKHSWTALDDMSPYLPQAVMASEDQKFLTHHGFDFDAIKEAAEINAKSDGKRLHGGSTITQQTAKNVFLWPGRSWLRKGLEAYFTVLIELLWDKERIMEVYLNSIEMGDGIYGAQAVAKHKFGTDAMYLTKQQCALIAATLPNPLRYDSANPSAYMLKRKRQILRQMRYVGQMPRESAATED